MHIVIALASPARVVRRAASRAGSRLHIRNSFTLENRSAGRGYRLSAIGYRLFSPMGALPTSLPGYLRHARHVRHLPQHSRPAPLALRSPSPPPPPAKSFSPAAAPGARKAGGGWGERVLRKFAVFYESSAFRLPTPGSRLPIPDCALSPLSPLVVLPSLRLPHR